MTYGRALAVGMAVGLLALAGAASSWAHSPVEHGKPSERELRRLETRVLGADHAAEHARERRLERRSRARWQRLTPARRHELRKQQRRDRLQLTARVAAVNDPATEGRWDAQELNLPVVGVNATMLPTGKVMWFSRRDRADGRNEATAYLWDPSKQSDDPAALRRVDPPMVDGHPVNLFCAGQSLLADGQLLVTGGNLAYPAQGTDYWRGLNRIYTFDPWAETWAEQPAMAHGRWYPTQTLLPDGRTLIVAGRDETGDAVDATNLDIELFNPPATRGGQGTVTKVGEYGALPKLPAKPAYYPHWFVMPDGNLLNAGPTREESWVLNFAGAAPSSADRPNWVRQHLYGTGVLLPGDWQGSTRVAQIGGFGWFPGAPTGDPEPQREATEDSEVFDEAHPTTPPAPGPALVRARAHHNTVLLPDGSMVSVGGGNGNKGGDLYAADGDQKEIEIWDPVTASWRLGPAQAYKRTYHSTAVLLPDGRVVSAGDDGDALKRNGNFGLDVAEIYEPPYLFAPGPRPAITAAPDSVSWNQPFAVQTSSPITRAVLMAPGATTHANDMQQRHVELRITPNGAGAELMSPPNANVAPPGWYMLFALSADGKPSIAKWIKLGPITVPDPTVGGQPPAATDTTAPVFGIAHISKGLRRALKQGLRLVLQSDEGGTARITASVTRATARKLNLSRRAHGPVKVGAVERAVPGGRSAVVVKLSAKASKAMRKARKAKLLITVVIADAAGHEARRTATVKLKR